MESPRFRLAGMAVLVVAVLTGIAFAAEPAAPAKPPAPAAPGIAPEAKAIMEKFADYAAGLKSWRVEVATTITLTAAQGGAPQSMAAVHDVAVRRPDHVALILKEGLQGVTAVYNSKTLTVYIPTLKKYTVIDKPADLHMIFIMGSVGTNFLRGLLQDKPYDALMQYVTQARYNGKDKVGDVECDRVVLLQKVPGMKDVQLEWQAWIRSGKEPLVMKIAADLTPLTKSQNLPGVAKVEAEALYKNWQPDVAIADEVFTFTPPEGAQLVKNMFGQEPASSLEGKEAPDFTLPLLDGAKVKLSDLRGKVVILDFWATWCGPCRKALPIVASVAKEYKDKGVVLYAVNSREDAEKVRAFLKEEKIDATVALDTEGQVNELYGVTGIPHTVIIDKKGVVRVVHEGYTKDLADRLKKQIDAVLAGKEEPAGK